MDIKNSITHHYNTMDVLTQNVLAIAQQTIEQNNEEYPNNIVLFREAFFKQFVLDICIALNTPIPNQPPTQQNPRTKPENITQFLAYVIEYEYVEDLCGVLLDIVDRLTYCIEYSDYIKTQTNINQPLLAELQQTELYLRQGLYMFRLLWISLNIELRYKIYHMLADDYGIDLNE